MEESGGREEEGGEGKRIPREVPCVLVLLLQLKPRNKGPPITQRPAPQLTPPHTHHLAGALSPYVVNVLKAVPMSFIPACFKGHP